MQPRFIVLFVSLLFLLAVPADARAQSASVRGVVREAATARPVPYAVVELVGTGRRFSADDAGRYQIDELAAGTWTLRAQALGFAATDAIVVIGSGSPAVIERDFLLPTDALELEGIVVEGAGAPRAVPDDPAGAPPARIEQARIAAVPVLFEPDVLRVVQTLPSVATASDFSAALYVRGATPDQTIVLLDGTPLFNPYHLGGLFSAIDVGLVQDVVAHVGPSSASLGDRLAGTIEINSQAPPLASPRGWGNIGLVSANAGVSGPVLDGGYTVAVRNTYIDLMTRLAHEAGLMKFAFPYGFQDGYAHMRHPVGPGELRASAYVNHEYISPPGDEAPDQDIDFDWGTGAASTSWEGSIGAQLVARGSLGFSWFEGDFFGRDRDDPGPPAIEANLRNRVLRPAIDFLWLARRADVRFGVAAELYEFGYRMETTENDFDQIFPELDTNSDLQTLAAHVETEWQTGGDTRWRVGARALAAHDGGVALMPRIGWSRDLDDAWTVFASAGRKAQAVRSLRSEEAVFSSVFAYDVLAPTGGRLATGDEVAAGFEWRPLPTSVLRVEAYGRLARDVPIAPVPGNIYFTPLLVPDETVLAEDRAAGLEISGSHRWRDTEVWLSYSGSWLQRTVGDETFTPRFHRAHHLQLLGTQSMWARTALSASFQLGSGQPYSRAVAWSAPLRFDPETGRWFATGDRGILLGERNEDRLPFYLRLDVGLRSSFTPRMFGEDVTISPYLSVLNAIAYRNSTFAYYDVLFSANGPGSIGETHAPQMPLLPTVGMEWRF